MNVDDLFENNTNCDCGLLLPTDKTKKTDIGSYYCPCCYKELCSRTCKGKHMESIHGYETLGG